MKLIIPRPGETLMQLAKRCNAVYVCPKVDGQRKGSLVAYAAKDEQGRNLVGDIYFNFRKVEVHLPAVEAFAEIARLKLEDLELLDSFDTICGVPNGGRTFGQELARLSGKRFCYPEKIPKIKEEGKKQEYTWDLSQFELDPGERVAVCEDVFNNFKNTDSTLTEIGLSGAEVVVMVGALNRSPIYDSIYTPKNGTFSARPIPVVASIREAFPEFEQSDPEVADDIAAGKLELEVKKNWARLVAAMGQ